MHRGHRTGLAFRGSTVAFGEYGLMSTERCWLDTKQIEAARVAIARNMKRHGKMWIRIFPQKSYTKKPLETRMGKGKGPLESWVAVIRPANVLFEVDGVSEADARESLRLAATTLPNSGSYLGARYRTLRSRIGTTKAPKAIARYLACLVYRLVTRGEEYYDRGQAAYQRKQSERQLAALNRPAASLGFIAGCWTHGVPPRPDGTD